MGRFAGHEKSAGLSFKDYLKALDDVDADGDGVKTRAEILAGTNPGDRNSKPRAGAELSSGVRRHPDRPTISPAR